MVRAVVSIPPFCSGARGTERGEHLYRSMRTRAFPVASGAWHSPVPAACQPTPPWESIAWRQALTWVPQESKRATGLPIRAPACHRAPVVSKKADTWAAARPNLEQGDVRGSDGWQAGPELCRKQAERLGSDKGHCWWYEAGGKRTGGWIPPAKHALCG